MDKFDRLWRDLVLTGLRSWKEQINQPEWNPERLSRKLTEPGSRVDLHFREIRRHIAEVESILKDMR